MQEREGVFTDVTAFLASVWSAAVLVTPYGVFRVQRLVTRRGLTKGVEMSILRSQHAALEGAVDKAP